jgi:cytochrome c-type biogenesis protein CcmF
LRSSAGFELGARESFLLFNNILFVIAAAIVFGGTMAPLIADALGLPTLSVGTPYFNPTFLMPVLPLLALLPVGLHAKWKKGRLAENKRGIISTLAVALVLSLAVSLGVFSHAKILTLVGLALGPWIILSSLLDPIDRWRRKLSLAPAVLGMTIAHIGVGLFVIGITVVQSFTQEHDVALGRGEGAAVGGYEFRFLGVQALEGPNYEGVRGSVVMTRHGAPLGTLYPEKRRYWVQGTVTTEAAIQMNRGTNVLIALGDDLGAGRWSVRIQVRPLVSLVWLAALIMAIGGAVALSDRRYRPAARSAAEAAAASDAVAGAAG